METQLNAPYQPLDPGHRGHRLIRKRTVAFVSVLFLVGSSGFLMWEHFKYQDVAPPKDISIWRDVCAGIVFASITILIFVAVAICTKKWKLSSHESNKCRVRGLGLVLSWYILAGLYWGATYIYYEMQNHSMSTVVDVFHWISLVYFVLVTVTIIMLSLCQAPSEAINCICLEIRGC